MLESLVLAVGSFLGGSDGMAFHEVEMEIPSGISEISSDMSWNAVSLFSLDGEVLPEISYQNKEGDFVSWPQENDFHEEIASHDHEEEGLGGGNLLQMLYVDDAVDSLTIRSDDTVRVVAHFYNTLSSDENLVAEFNPFHDSDFDPFDNDRFDNPETGLPDKVKKPRYISREEWGVDKDILVWDPRGTRGKFLRKWFNTEAELLEPKHRPKLVRQRDEKGRHLFWPVSESPLIHKVTIHHTGEVVKEKYLKNPKALVRAIFAYHTVTRGWGDIGYQYVIDKQGNIYEGRSGGPRAVGAHVAYRNIGNMGVSLMGNFEIEEPTEAQIRVLALLLADHANRFQINPKGRGFYFGKNSYNILGHRDIAVAGHGTSCPGRNLAKHIPSIRSQVAYLSDVMYRQEKSDAVMARDFLGKTAAGRITPYKKFSRPEKEPLIGLSKLLKKKIIQRNDRKVIDVHIKNGTKELWKKGTTLVPRNVPEGMTSTRFTSKEIIPPGRSGVFRGRVVVKETPNGLYDLILDPVFLKDKFFAEQSRPQLTVPLQISGEFKRISAANRGAQDGETKKRPSYFKKLSASAFKSSAPQIKSLDVPTVKVKLAFFDGNYVNVETKEKAYILEKGNKIDWIPPSTPLKVVSKWDEKNKKRFLEVSTERETWNLRDVSLVTEGIWTIKNYDRGLGRLPYNEFRRRLNIHPKPEGSLLVVNELPIEEYLWGLAEEPTSEPDNKKHAIHILARSYAYVYSGFKRKFGTLLYDLEDDPATSQYYLGYMWERTHIKQKNLVKETKGTLLTYEGKPVIGPYFTQSSGMSSDKWQSAYPWAKARKLPFDKGLQAKGHGVGLSGNSARELARRGYKHGEILDYFFDGTDVKKVY